MITFVGHMVNWLLWERTKYGFYAEYMMIMGSKIQKT